MTNISDRPTVGPLTCVNQASWAALDEALGRWGHRVFFLSGDQVTDKQSLLAQVERDLPMPAGLHPHNWDALADCLWGGLAEVSSERVAIVWTHAQTLLEADLQTFLTAVGIFTSLARQVLTTEHGFPHIMELNVFLIGTGSNFPAYPTS